MPAHVTRPPKLLAVTFFRDGEEPIRIEVADGDKALTRATAMTLMHGRLQPGDVLTVTEVKVDD